MKYEVIGYIKLEAPELQTGLKSNSFGQIVRTAEMSDIRQVKEIITLDGYGRFDEAEQEFLKMHPNAIVRVVGYR